MYFKSITFKKIAPSKIDCPFFFMYIWADDIINGTKNQEDQLVRLVNIIINK